MKTMLAKQQKFATLVASVCLLSLIIGLNAASNDEKPIPHKLSKRQTAVAASAQRPQASVSDQDVATRPASNLVSQGIGMASASASVLSTGDQLGAGPIAGNKRRKKPKIPVELDAETLEDDEAEGERSRRVKRPSRKRLAVSKQPSRSDEADDENCHEIDDYEDYADFHPESFHEAAARPMRQFSRMMEGMFNQMRGLSGGDLGGLAGSNSVVASASSSGGDDYSRTSSMVTRNGRTRGIVTETKGGRTKTRRIDSGDANDEDED